jgi:hypothetical protein
MVAQEPMMLPLPDTVQGCRTRLVDLQAEIASIKTQIATADIERQARRGVVDAHAFHRARTALRFKQQEMGRVAARLAELSGQAPRERFKDTLIGVLREQMDEATWQSAMAIARQREAEVIHG